MAIWATEIRIVDVFVQLFRKYTDDLSSINQSLDANGPQDVSIANVADVWV